MRIDVVTIFPELFEAPLRTSLLGKAISSGILAVEVHDLRRDGVGRHSSVDDEPYGGGAGMVMRPEPIFAAVERVASETSHVILLSPKGAVLDQAVAARLARLDHFILVCGRYEGIDERVALHLADEEISIGDYVIAGGEVAALVVIEAVGRLVPGVIGNEGSLATESHSGGLLEYPHYTRPAEFRGYRVPDVLLSGDHAAVETWRRREAERVTAHRRPDLVEGRAPSEHAGDEPPQEG